MTETSITEYKCNACNRWYPSPIAFGDPQSFSSATIEGNITTCPKGHKVTINKDNMRFRYKDGKELCIEGKDTL